MLVRRAPSTGEFKDHRVEADQRLAAAVGSSQDAILSADREGVITAWSGGAERLFGYTQREAIGQPVSLMYPPAYRGEDRELVRRVMAGEHIESHVTERMHKDGSVLGGLNWSSQHVDPGGGDGQASWVDDGVDGQGADEVAGEAVVASGRGAVVLA